MRIACLLSLILMWSIPNGRILAQSSSARADNHLAEMMSLMASAAAQAPALRRQAAALSMDELIDALAAHGGNSRRAGTIKSPDNTAQLPADLSAVYARPDAAAQLQWLAPTDVKPVARFFDDWRTELKLAGEGDDAILKVEPLEAIFATRLAAAPLADWLVLSDNRPYGSLILYNPSDSGPKCCRVLDIPGTGSSLPTAYGSLREHLEFEWLTAELVARRAASKP